MVLKDQTDQIRAFDGEQYMSTEADVLGREIWRLMKHVERNTLETAGDEPVIRRLELVI